MLVAGALSIGALGISSQASSADKNGNYTVHALEGANTCAFVLRVTDAENARRDRLADNSPASKYSSDWQIVTAYVGGYLSAFNLLTPITNDIVGSGGLAGAKLWLTNHCRLNPTDSLDAALKEFTFSNFSKRIVSKGN
ncbi:hypothetical protein [Bosea sp. BIWAKO-01]|uniref:hypothetical protein n=1 Tax=Bosea sp. BIWAKO-01 TaxID=506668 RepID=UPI00114CEDF5|nr:hypothetical protein [Bosea sp. BIWAKO-01]